MSYHQASYIAAEANFEVQRDFLRRAVSNLKLFNKTLIVSYTSAFKIHPESLGKDIGSLSYELRKNFSLFTRMYYKAEYSGYQENSGIRKAISSRNLSTLSFGLAKSLIER